MSKVKTGFRGINERRKTALQYLENQLRANVKPDPANAGKVIALSPKDKERVTKEIGILKSKIL